MKESDDLPFRLNLPDTLHLPSHTSWSEYDSCTTDGLSQIVGSDCYGSLFALYPDDRQIWVTGRISIIRITRRLLVLAMGCDGSRHRYSISIAAVFGKNNAFLTQDIRQPNPWESQQSIIWTGYTNIIFTWFQNSTTQDYFWHRLPNQISLHYKDWWKNGITASISQELTMGEGKDAKNEVLVVFRGWRHQASQLNFWISFFLGSSKINLFSNFFFSAFTS